jgi:hypothetical protein
MDTQELETFRKWMQRFKTSENYCRPFFDKGEENYLLYKSYKKGSDKVYKHDIFVPYSFAYLEDSAAYFMLSVVSAPQVYSIGRRYTGVSLELCLACEAVVNWVMTEEATEFALELEELIKNINIFNAAYLVNYPVVKERREGEKVVNYFERLQLDSPSPLDVFPEPAVKRLSRMNWIIKRSREDWDVLKKWEKDGIYKNVDEAKGGSTGSEEDPILKLLSDIGLSSTGNWAYDPESNKVELLDCMTGGDVITIAGRRTVIRDTTPDPIRPFLFDFPMLDCRFEGAPGEHFGVGKIESIKPTQQELNTLRSQRRDNISLLLNKLFVYDILAGEVDLNTLFSAPGNVIITTNREALDELPLSDVTASSYKEEESLIYDLQNITSMWDYARGGTPRRKETATGIVRLQQAAQSRNEWQLKKLDYYILTPLARRILVYIRENMPRADFLEIIGTGNEAVVEEFYALSTRDIRRYFKFMPMTESIVSLKEVDMNQFLQAFDRLIQIPEVNRVSLMKQLLLKLGQKDVKEILPMLSGPGQEATMQTMGQMPPGAPPGGMPMPMGPQGMPGGGE